MHLGAVDNADLRTLLEIIRRIMYNVHLLYRTRMIEFNVVISCHAIIDAFFFCFFFLRNVYDVYSFLTIFLNASIGFFAFIKRILMGAFLGVFLIPRMDRSLLMRGYEAMDKCLYHLFFLIET